MAETFLEVRNLSKTFRYRTGLFRKMNLEAVKPVSFTLRENRRWRLSVKTARVNRRWRKCFPAWWNRAAVRF